MNASMDGLWIRSCIMDFIDMTQRIITGRFTFTLCSCRRVCSTMFILGLLGLWKSGRVNYLWYAGMGMAGMILTKETYAIHVACAVIAIPVLMVSYALNRVPDAKPTKQTWSYIDLAMVLGM